MSQHWLRTVFLSKGGAVKNAEHPLNMGSALNLVGFWELKGCTAFAFCSGPGVCLGTRVGRGKK